MPICTFFSVESGNHKGNYVSITNDVSWEEQRELMGARFHCGAIQDSAADFYYRHGAWDKATIWSIDGYGYRVQAKKVVEIERAFEEAGWTILGLLRDNMVA